MIILSPGIQLANRQAQLELKFLLSADKLLHLLQSRPSDVFIVFCNTVPSCDWTARFLIKNDVPVIKLHAGFSSQVSFVKLNMGNWIEGNA